ncbi:GTP-binding protein ERG isoform X1 [Cynara cardunculus var. scolymus]|uniref:GTP-binding protein ERG isoform X1 n=1 Tax=Cynara cardunculus var. scolymus TaxID=59895 RepID=UPI000D62C918|nr:GTP-binding protein ERG isoform X1 [Cynara cardunculus var. scolymus]
MKALRLLQILTTRSSRTSHLNPTFLFRFYASQPLQENPVLEIEESRTTDNNGFGFDSSHYELPDTNLGLGSNEAETPAGNRESTWDEKYRRKANRSIFGEEHEKLVKDKKSKKKSRSERMMEQEEKRRRTAILSKALLEAAVAATDDDEEEDANEVVKVEDQLSLSVGIIGAPNAGKSALTNFMVGTKVAAVSRKTNTTTHEVLGVMTQGKTQICFFDTPGLIMRSNGLPKSDIKVRVESAWSSVNLYDMLVVIFDVHRHLTRPDKRVVKLIKQMGSQVNPKQKRILCMNKVDLVEKKKDLLKVAEQFNDLPGYERYFMISGLKGSGVKDLTQYLMEQAVKRPWDEDPLIMTEDVMKNISLEVVREKFLDHVHQEIPYDVEHRLIDWKELRDGSVRIEQHLITNKVSQRKIIVGKNGSKIGRIGVEANEELRSIFKRNVHLILLVRLK